MSKKTHVVLPGSKRGRDTAATRIGKVDPQERVVVTIGLAGPKLPGTDEYIGQTLSPKELAEKFGAKQADADKVAKSLLKFGLKVEDVSLETRSMRVSGPAKAMEAAFKPCMAIMRSARDGENRGRQGAIQIPAELKGIVTGVFVLDQRRMARRRSGASASASAASKLSPLAPADRLPGGWPTGRLSLRERTVPQVASAQCGLER
jgi:kumamolisin